MSRDLAAIVAPAIDLKQIERAIARVHVALQDDERTEKRDASRAAESREAASRRRLELGRLLVEARRAHGHGEWIPFLKRQGIAERSAREWMALAEQVKSAPSASGADLPSRREVAACRRRAEEQPDLPAAVAVAVQAAAAAALVEADDDDEDDEHDHDIDVDQELIGIHGVMERARAWPVAARRALVAELKRMAAAIEAMSAATTAIARPASARKREATRDGGDR